MDLPIISDLGLSPSAAIAILAIILSALFTFFALLFAMYAQSQAAQAKRSRELLQIGKLFSSLDRARELSIRHPDLLLDVYDIDKELITPEGQKGHEAAAIAFLNLVLDGYMHYYGEKYRWNFKRMVRALKKRSMPLNKMLRVKANQRRFYVLKKLYYADGQEGFVKAIDALIEFEKARSEEESQGEKINLDAF